MDNYKPSLFSGNFGSYAYYKHNLSQKLLSLIVPDKVQTLPKTGTFLEHVAELAEKCGETIVLQDEQPGDCILLMSVLQHKFSDLDLIYTNTGFKDVVANFCVRYKCNCVLELVTEGKPFNVYRIKDLSIFVDREERELWQTGFFRRLKIRWQRWKLNKTYGYSSEEFPNMESSMVALEGLVIRKYDTYYHIIDFNSAHYSYVVINPFTAVFNQSLACVHRDKLQSKVTSSVILLWKQFKDVGLLLSQNDTVDVINAAMFYADFVQNHVDADGKGLVVKYKFFSTLRTIVKTAAKNLVTTCYKEGKRTSFAGFCGQQNSYKPECRNCHLLSFDSNLCMCDEYTEVQCYKYARCLANQDVLRYPNKQICQAYTIYHQRMGFEKPVTVHDDLNKLMGFAQAILPLILNVNSVDRPMLNTWLENLKSGQKYAYGNATVNVMNAGFIDVKQLEVKCFPKVEPTISKVDGCFDNRPARGISGRYEEYNVLLGPYINLSSKVLQQSWSYYERPGLLGVSVERNTNITYACGMNKLEQGNWLKVVEDDFSEPIYYNTDYSKFDGHITVQLLNVEHLLYAYLFENSENLLKVMRTQFETFGAIKYNREDAPVRYQVNGTRKSGDQNTSVGNSFLNVICQLHCINQQYDVKYLLENDMLRMIVMGDDTVLAFDGLTLDVDKYINSMLKIGLDIKIQQGTKYNINFCSASFVPAIYAGKETYVLTQLLGRNCLKAYVTDIFNSKQYAKRHDLWGGWVKSNAFAYRQDYAHIPFMMNWHHSTYLESQRHVALKLSQKEFYKHIGVAILPSLKLFDFISERYGLTLTEFNKINSSHIMKHKDIAWRFFDRDMRPDDCDNPYLPPKEVIVSNLQGKTWQFASKDNKDYKLKLQGLDNSTLIDTTTEYTYYPKHEAPAEMPRSDQASNKFETLRYRKLDVDDEKGDEPDGDKPLFSRWRPKGRNKCSKQLMYAEEIEALL